MDCPEQSIELSWLDDVTVGPQCVALLNDRWLIIMAQDNDRDRAQGAYERAVRLNPEQCAPYILIAKFHQRRSKIEQSLVCYRKARILSPLDEELEQSESQLQERSDRK